MDIERGIPRASEVPKPCLPRSLVPLPKKSLASCFMGKTVNNPIKAKVLDFTYLTLNYGCWAQSLDPLPLKPPIDQI